MGILFKLIPIIFWGIFITVILQVPYPDSLVQANFIQIFFFFIPLFLAFLFTINFFIKNVLVSSSISLGIIFLLILKALDSLNLVTIILIIAATILFISYFKKNKRSLTNGLKIPKLTHMRKHKASS